jgi:hypothetical protein
VNTTGLGATLDPSSLESVSGENNQTGIKGEISLSEDFEFGVTVSKRFTMNMPLTGQLGVSEQYETTSSLEEPSSTPSLIGHWATMMNLPLHLSVTGSTGRRSNTSRLTLYPMGTSPSPQMPILPYHLKSA